MEPFRSRPPKILQPRINAGERHHLAITQELDVIDSKYGHLFRNVNAISRADLNQGGGEVVLPSEDR